MGSWLRRLFASPDAARPEAPAATSIATATVHAGFAPAAPVAAPIDVDVAFHRWLLDGDAARVPDDSERALYDALCNAAADPRLASRVPRVPAIVPPLLQMLRDPSRQAHDVADQLAQDPVLVAAVLRVANSPWYAAGRRIESIDQAVLILGQDGLRQLVASVAMKPLINVQSGHFTRGGAPRVWEQSERACAACRTLARGDGHAFEAYLGVLLVNMGTIVALRVLDERHRDGVAPGSDAFCTALDGVVRGLAVTIGRQWEFPATVVAALATNATLPPAALVAAAERTSRLSVLVDAGCVSPDQARAAVADAPALAACFEALSANAA